MLEFVSFLFVLIGPVIWISLAIIIAYLIVKRLEARDKEDFEKRDN